VAGGGPVLAGWPCARVDVPVAGALRTCPVCGAREGCIGGIPRGRGGVTETTSEARAPPRQASARRSTRWAG
jgi:hypothetical protein